MQTEPINKIRKGSLSYSKFYKRYIKNNCPVIITRVSNEWECSKSWIHSDGSVINFTYLKHKIADHLVTVTKCSPNYKENCLVKLAFHNFLDFWEKNNNFENEESNLYLKDWHLMAQLPLYEFYKVPSYFSSDWLNEYLVKHGRDDYRFVYMGPKNSGTPFHVDVFGSFSWSTNIYGCKKWILLPPGEQYKIRDCFGNINCNINEKELNESNVSFCVIYQQKNEAVFVPSGWYHQVWNITDTISVNHNWFNAANIRYIWHNISENLRKVINEIKDFRRISNFEAECQAILRANFGLNISDFLDILRFISETRWNLITSRRKNVLLNMSTSLVADSHLHNDLKSINVVLKAMTQDKFVHSTTAYERCMKYIHL